MEMEMFEVGKKYGVRSYCMGIWMCNEKADATIVKMTRCFATLRLDNGTEKRVKLRQDSFGNYLMWKDEEDPNIYEYGIRPWFEVGSN